MGVRELIESKRDEILVIAARHHTRNVRVFGSVARDESNDASDIDLLVELEPGCGFLEHAALERELRELLGRRVDVVSEKGLRQRIRDRVMREAVAL